MITGEARPVSALTLEIGLAMQDKVKVISIARSCPGLDNVCVIMTKATFRFNDWLSIFTFGGVVPKGEFNVTLCCYFLYILYLIVEIECKFITSSEQNKFICRNTVISLKVLNAKEQVFKTQSNITKSCVNLYIYIYLYEYKLSCFYLQTA